MKSVEEIESLALKSLREGDLEKAIDLFKKAIQKGSQNFSCRFLLSRALLELERANVNRSIEFEETCNLLTQINEVVHEKINFNQKTQK